MYKYAVEISVNSMTEQQISCWISR